MIINFFYDYYVIALINFTSFVLLHELPQSCLRWGVCKVAQSGVFVVSGSSSRA